ncbi:MAG: Vacuolar fusion protein mon1 [Caeruleum heppii]|nr:MAG: Vacuolar fusion protein mon1 [Caeruleum heppii]
MGDHPEEPPAEPEDDERGSIRTLTSETVDDAPPEGPTSSDDKDGQPTAVDSEPLSDSQHTSTSEEGPPPPLPPRPIPTKAPSSLLNPLSSLRGTTRSSRPQLHTQATTALSLTDVHTHARPDSLRNVHDSRRALSRTPSYSTISNFRHGHVEPHSGSDAAETNSIRSHAPTLEATGDIESLLGEVLSSENRSPTWKLMSAQRDISSPFDAVAEEDTEFEKTFRHEFSPIGELDEGGSNEEALLLDWKSRLKHFLILSQAGKPIYTRHGDPSLVSSYIGILQTIISSFQRQDKPNNKDPLRSFTAGSTTFVIVTEGPLHLVAISRDLEESDAQLRNQLDALYMQILSTLTLPVLNQLFSNRPSTDLRKPLQGTAPLLSGLSDTFTRGSPPTLLSALECLKLRKTDRSAINNVLLRLRTPDLLYGLIVAGGRLVSVIRPKRHSLHPGDLQLLFNMLFEADGIKAGGGENWIPLCLPGFNKGGYLYMYVSFIGASDSVGDGANEENGASPQDNDSREKEDQIAIILISTNKESFYDMQRMRNETIETLTRTALLSKITASISAGRPQVTDIIPGTAIRHFLYKSKANVQFVMPSYEPDFCTEVARRKLHTLYASLHASLHSQLAPQKLHHRVPFPSSTSTHAIANLSALAYSTPVFELYVVASPSATKAAIAQGANMLVRWARREEERIFILGGAVF